MLPTATEASDKVVSVVSVLADVETASNVPGAPSVGLVHSSKFTVIVEDALVLMPRTVSVIQCGAHSVSTGSTVTSS